MPGYLWLSTPLATWLTSYVYSTKLIPGRGADTKLD